MACYEEITIRMAEGYSAYGRYWSPETCRGSILHLHGIQSHSGWYEASARALCEAGYAVLQPDRRGSGQNQQQRGHADSSEQLLADGRACLDELGRRSGRASSYVLGISWGGKMACAMYADNPEGISGLILVTPGLFPIVDVSPAEKFRIGISMLSSPSKQYGIPLNDPELFTADAKWQAYLRDDALQLHEATAGFFLASRRMDKVARRLPESKPVPLLTMLAKDERIIDNVETTEFVRKMNWPERKIITYENSRHTLEFDSDKDYYLEDLVGWLGAHA